MCAPFSKCGRTFLTAAKDTDSLLVWGRSALILKYYTVTEKHPWA